ncbi:MAG: sigma-70 family RNA polymerase sigma factor [Chloroflexi bacterium]|nr:MAG: sigma-70 family RNA polymerase sigma factor [Chloroflexota bacterium]
MTSATAKDRESGQVSVDRQAQEQQWAAEARQGDRDAFMQLVQAYQRPVYNLCYRMLGDAAEAEDAAQETFLRAYTRLRTYQPGRKFSSWILSIASHYCIDHLRKQRYHQVPWDDLPPDRMLSASDPEPEQAALSRERDRSVHQLLDTLPAEYRLAVILRYWHNMSYEEIAVLMETTVSAVKSRLFRARQMMAKQARQTGGADQ